ncbi:hypothetical protein EBU71_04005 [bacterium]|jgi:hypothetical protein|nr:hypothetical protein [Candidatus Elulimicrobium humile]
MNFFCVYTKNRKKIDKFFKVNGIRNKYVIDLAKIISKEEIENYDDEKTFLKILVYQKVQSAIERGKDIYYIPDFEKEFSIEKLLNLKKLLGSENNFNILIFWNEFKKDAHLLDDIMENMSKFSNSQIIKDY